MKSFMKTHLNTLYVTTDGCYLSKDGETVTVSLEREVKLRLPFHNLDGIVCMGRIGLSPQLMQAASQAGISISLLDDRGRFRAAIQGFTSGNVLLRREQYRAADHESRTLEIARQAVIGKLANCRTVLVRAIRDANLHEPRVQTLEQSTTRIKIAIESARTVADVDALRGIEGEAATHYFDAFNSLQTRFLPFFAFRKRSKRPPLDPINCLISFIYTLLTHDVRSACEAVGLDAAVGYLHKDRPGRPSLALDLMEEFRPWLADRVAFSLINRQQLDQKSFQFLENGAVLLTPEARKVILTTWQQRKAEEIFHPLANEKVTIGILPLIQARILARHLRGDLDCYPPFLWK
jgi:CRISPR-associated protein Cas1